MKLLYFILLLSLNIFCISSCWFEGCNEVLNTNDKNKITCYCNGGNKHFSFQKKNQTISKRIFSMKIENSGDISNEAFKGLEIDELNIINSKLSNLILTSSNLSLKVLNLINVSATNVELSNLANLTTLNDPNSNHKNNNLENIVLLDLSSLNSVQLTHSRINQLYITNTPKLNHLNIRSNQVFKKNTNSKYNFKKFDFFLNLHNHEAYVLNLKNLTSLTIKDSQLKKITLEHLNKIKILDLSDNLLQHLSLSKNSTDLQSLNLANNYLSSLPNLTEYKNIQYITFSNQNGHLKSLHKDAFLHTKNLVELVLDSNELKHFYLNNLSKIEHINLNNNRLIDLNVSGLPRLMQLYLNNNYLNKNPNLTEFKMLKKFLFSDQNGKLHNLDLGLLPTSLESLSLASNGLKTLQIEKLANFSKLEELDLAENRLNEINLNNNKKIKTIKLNNNNITKYTIKDQEMVQILDLSSNRIDSIQIKNSFVFLLNVSNNRLKEFNYSDGYIKSLDLSGNKLNSIFIANSSELKYLDLSDNYFTQVPDLKITNLSVLKMANQNGKLNEILNNSFSFFAKEQSELDLSNNKLKKFNLSGDKIGVQFITIDCDLKLSDCFYFNLRKKLKYNSANKNDLCNKKISRSNETLCAKSEKS